MEDILGLYERVGGGVIQLTLFLHPQIRVNYIITTNHLSFNSEHFMCLLLYLDVTAAKIHQVYVQLCWLEQTLF